MYLTIFKRFTNHDLTVIGSMLHSEALFTRTDNDDVKKRVAWQHIRVFTLGLSIWLNGSWDPFRPSTIDTMLNVKTGRILVSVRMNTASIVHTF